MSQPEDRNGTDLLLSHTHGDPTAADRLLPLVYDQLKALAGRFMKGERAGHTLQATALVHEAYIRLVDLDRIDWRGRTHFFAMAARQMRRILVDHARGFGAKKRGADARRVTLDTQAPLAQPDPTDLLALDEALARLAEKDDRQARVAEMRLFAGMQVKEIAAALGVSERTVKSDWRFARESLVRQLRGDAG